MVRLSTVRHSSKMCYIHITQSHMQKAGSYKVHIEYVLLVCLARIAKKIGAIFPLLPMEIFVARRVTMLKKCQMVPRTTANSTEWNKAHCNILRTTPYWRLSLIVYIRNYSFDALSL